MFETQRSLLLENLDAAHAAYYEAAVFGGPSLHFHQRALATAQAQNLEAFTEAAYAMLASWGMHRMGTGGSKMREFDDFVTSINCVWQRLQRLQSKDRLHLSEDDWGDLKRVFFEINAMRSETSLVGNSKVMAHALPKLVAPVDREYTLTLLFGHKRIRNGKEAEWNTLRTVLENFFYPVSTSDVFAAKASVWMEQSTSFKWDTSPLKVVDNLIIGLQKRSRAEQAQSAVRTREAGPRAP